MGKKNHKNIQIKPLLLIIFSAFQIKGASATTKIPCVIIFSLSYAGNIWLLCFLSFRRETKGSDNPVVTLQRGRWCE